MKWVVGVGEAIAGNDGEVVSDDEEEGKEGLVETKIRGE